VRPGGLIPLVITALALLCVSAPAALSQTIVLDPDLATPAEAWSVLSAVGVTPATVPVGIGPIGGAGISYQGGPVLNTNRTHLIFWQPSGSGLMFDPGYIALVEQFLGDVAAASHATSNEYGITGEYYDLNGPAAYASTYDGAVLDTDPLPPNGCTEPALTAAPGWTTCLTDAQLQAELLHVISTHHLPHGHTNIFFLVTPDGFGSCTDSSSASCALGGSDNGYCGYHSATASGIIYAVIPYNAVPGHCQSTNPRPNGATADPALSAISHEQAESITDPLGTGWINSQGEEIADVCIANYGRALGGTGATRWDETINGHHYWLQELFSRFQGACEPRPQPDSASIRGPSRARTGSVLHFTARASQPGGSIIAYDWSFGDGHRGRGRHVHHAFRRAGIYLVTLRATDSSGNWAYAIRRVRVRLGRPEGIRRRPAPAAVSDGPVRR